MPLLLLGTLWLAVDLAVLWLARRWLIAQFRHLFGLVRDPRSSGMDPRCHTHGVGDPCRLCE